MTGITLPDELLPVAIETLRSDQFLIAPYHSNRQALVSHRFAVANAAAFKQNSAIMWRCRGIKKRRWGVASTGWITSVIFTKKDWAWRGITTMRSCGTAGRRQREVELECM